MKYLETGITGSYVIELDKIEDDRGFFARLFCANEFRKNNLITEFVQINNSLSKTKGVLRGLHYQLPPHSEVKIVRCIRGSLFDVILDLRPDSPSYCQWFGVELSGDNRRMIYVPRGCAHGFITLEQNTEALYLTSNYYFPSAERGVRYDDPRFSIQWPIEPVEVSEKDQEWPDFEPEFHGVILMNKMI